MNNEKLIPQWLIDNSSMENAIDEAINDYIWKQKQAYGIEYTKADFNVNPEDFTDKIQAYLDMCYSQHDNPFENENVATEYWLEYEGYDLIQKAIEA